MQCMTFYQMVSTYILLGPPGGNAVHNDIYLLVLLIFMHTHIITLCPEASLRARLHFLVGVPFHVLEGGPDYIFWQECVFMCLSLSYTTCSWLPFRDAISPSPIHFHHHLQLLGHLQTHYHLPTERH